ncbi:uncharacterized protein CMU_003810 [Cryptosporidium muris RN66]|uniref:Uncharacterized protein n=1 Tax=Cryptosporidium muris (strain RN66) TaxID=441375 RepID=B6AK01_CRYMR|nr:uncharacterized protein CMU_003810 [Cryptosporidium muris RN66]EEA08542.1 hypothetical protein, conserved [Cryptosporidium muris RN66]|eukprot:XP_002142891.1 hypothetical protein [Cryptosporidium muris RN66]
MIQFILARTVSSLCNCVSFLSGGPRTNVGLHYRGINKSKNDRTEYEIDSLLVDDDFVDELVATPLSAEEIAAKLATRNSKQHNNMWSGGIENNGMINETDADLSYVSYGENILHDSNQHYGSNFKNNRDKLMDNQANWWSKNEQEEISRLHPPLFIGRRNDEGINNASIDGGNYNDINLIDETLDITSFRIKYNSKYVGGEKHLNDLFSIGNDEWENSSEIPNDEHQSNQKVPIDMNQDVLVENVALSDWYSSYNDKIRHSTYESTKYKDSKLQAYNESEEIYENRIDGNSSPLLAKTNVPSLINTSKDDNVHHVSEIYLDSQNTAQKYKKEGFLFNLSQDSEVTLQSNFISPLISINNSEPSKSSIDHSLNNNDTTGNYQDLRTDILFDDEFNDFLGVNSPDFSSNNTNSDISGIKRKDILCNNDIDRDISVCEPKVEYNENVQIYRESKQRNSYLPERLQISCNLDVKDDTSELEYKSSQGLDKNNSYLNIDSNFKGKMSNDTQILNPSDKRSKSIQSNQSVFSKISDTSNGYHDDISLNLIPTIPNISIDNSDISSIPIKYKYDSHLNRNEDLLNYGHNQLIDFEESPPSPNYTTVNVEYIYKNSSIEGTKGNKGFQTENDISSSIKFEESFDLLDFVSASGEYSVNKEKPSIDPIYNIKDNTAI